MAGGLGAILLWRISRRSKRPLPGVSPVAASTTQPATANLPTVSTQTPVLEQKKADLQAYALGEAKVTHDDQVISSWRAADAKEMFFYILLQGPKRREEIGVDFWPDLDAKAMANRLNVTSYRMRQALGLEAEAVIGEGGVLRLDVDRWFDVEEFETLVQQARQLSSEDEKACELWLRAQRLYTGDLLPSVGREWCVLKREQLRMMYTEVLISLGQCHEAQQKWDDAIAWYKRTLEVDNLREDVHRHLMRCYAAAGRRADAVTQYHRCEAILEAELGIEPAPETRELYEKIGTN